MNKKYLLAIIPIVLVAACVQTPVTTTPTGGSVVTSEETYVLDDQIMAITEEQLNAIEMGDPDFVSNAEDSITNDMSTFYY